MDGMRMLKPNIHLAPILKLNVSIAKAKHTYFNANLDAGI
jgi:hypothetical protein